MYDNYNGNNGYQQPQQQQQGQGGDFWPNVTGFKIGPNKKGTGHTIQFTLNASSNAKSQPITFAEFMSEIQKAFQASGGNGVRIILPFRQGNGPRGPFQSASIGIMPNNPQQHFNRGGGGGGGRRSYPPQQGQGYGQPQPQWTGNAGGQPATAPQYPAQAAPNPPPQAAPQGTPQNGQNTSGQSMGPTTGGQAGNGQNAGTAYPSNGGGNVPF